MSTTSSNQRRYAAGDRRYAFVVLLLVLLAAWPFLARPGLPRDTDAELHVLRAAELLACWQGGVLYPRWAPDFYYGYGYPIFNYYAPLTYHLAALFSLLPGLDIVAGVKAVFVLALLLGGVGCYGLLRDLFGAEAGIVGIAAFLFAPYVLFIDPHARGDLAECFAVGLLPLALFVQRRLVGRGGRPALFGMTVLTAALLTSHNLLGPLGAGLLLAALLWQAVVEGAREGAGQGLLALLLGLAISAFFWLPMLLELDQVRLTVVGAGHFDFRNHFVSLGELLAPSRRIDLGATAPNYRLNVGLGQWLLALVGAAAGLGQTTHRRRALVFFALLGLGLLFLITPTSLPLWEAISPMAYLQFPWRLLGPAALALAVGAGAAVTLLPEQRWRPAALGGIVLGLLLLALPTVFPHPWAADFGDTSPAGIVRFELQGKVLGTTSTGDFLPRTVEVDLRPQESLVASYLGTGPIDKVNRATLPAGAVVEVLEHGPAHDRFRVVSEGGLILRVYTLYFPGWQAMVDGEPAPIEIGRPEGFVTVRVPAGEHKVLLRFEDTPPRRAGWGIAASGLAVLLLALLRTRPAQARPSEQTAGSTPIWMVGALLVFVLLRLPGEAQPGWFYYRSPPGQAQPARYSQHAVLGEQVEFLGYDLPRQRVRSGEELVITLYWRALQPLDTNYQSFVHLTYPSAISWGQSDALNPGGLPTTRWPTDRYVWDTHRLRIHPGTPPGEYALEVGLYTLADGRRLPVVMEGGAAGETVVLQVPVEVLPSRRPPPLSSLEMEEVGAVYDGQVALLGYNTPGPVTDVPGFLRLTLFWRAERRRPDDLVVTVAIVGADGQVEGMASGPPAVGRYPTWRWSRGEIVRDPYAFWLGDDFAPGVYTVGVAVHRGDQPITPAGFDDPFVQLFTVEVRPWQP